MGKETGLGATPMAISVDDVSFLVEEGKFVKDAYKEISAYVSSPSNLRKDIQVSIYKFRIMVLMGVTGTRLANL